MDILNFTKTIPSWLDQELFDKAIQSYEADPQAKVNDFQIEAATKPGDNFASAVFRAVLKYTSKYQKHEKLLSVIIKTQPVSVELPNMEHMQDTTLFKTEIAMYTKVLNHIQDLIDSVGYSDVVCPKLVYQTMTPKPVIMLEDVKTNGFDTMITTVPEDFELTKLIIKKLARFHAASFYLQDEKKIDASEFDSCLFKMENFVEMMFSDSFEILTDEMSKWEGFEQFIEPIKQFKGSFRERALRSYTPTPGPFAFNVLNHGDFHLKNLLYKMSSDTSEVEDLIMLDFQISVFASPAVDLVYSLLNFVSDDDRFTRYDELLAVYHQQFVEALTKFGYLKQPSSLLDLQIEMMRNGNLQAQNFLFMFPFLIFDVNTLTPSAFAAGQGEMKAKAYRDERYKKVIKEALKIFLAKGYL